MKRIIAILLATVLLSGTAIAADLSALSFNELMALRNECQLEMMKRTEWKEVRVPQGIWEVGKDIPAGSWVIKCADTGLDNVSMRICVLLWGEGYPKDENFEYKKRNGRVVVANPKSNYYAKYENGTPTEAKVVLENGQYVVIENGYNAAIFMRDFTTAPFTFD